jgi:hypothetical protein
MGLLQWCLAKATLGHKVHTGWDSIEIFIVSSRGKENVGICVFQSSKLGQDPSQDGFLL